MEHAGVEPELRERDVDGSRLVTVDRDHCDVGPAATVVDDETALGLDLVERALAKRRGRLPQGRDVANELSNVFVAAGPRHGTAVVRIRTTRQRDLGAVVENRCPRHREEIHDGLLETRLRGGVGDIAADETRHVVVVDEDGARVLATRAEVGRERWRRRELAEISARVETNADAVVRLEVRHRVDPCVEEARLVAVSGAIDLTEDPKPGVLGLYGAGPVEKEFLG